MRPQRPGRTARSAIALAALLAAGPIGAEPSAPLVLERAILLPGVAGRIDHLSIDLGRKRLLVAEVGNGSVDAVDLAEGRATARIVGLPGPQGVVYAPASDVIAASCGGDGTVRLYRAEDFSKIGQVSLGEDADNLRIDPRSGQVVAAYGSGGLAWIDPRNASKISDLPLPAHPEGFQLEPKTERLFVNLPDLRQIGVIDLRAARQASAWNIPNRKGNYPMAIDPNGEWLASVFRDPPRLALVDARSGSVVADLPTCGDADDAFFDARRGRLYVSCGAGAVAVFGVEKAGPRPLGQVALPPGGRTSLFVPELDRLFVAVRAGSRSDASILVLRPTD
jgi:hypothetical protein